MKRSATEEIQPRRCDQRLESARLRAVQSEDGEGGATLTKYGGQGKENGKPAREPHNQLQRNPGTYRVATDRSARPCGRFARLT